MMCGLQWTMEPSSQVAEAGPPEQPISTSRGPKPIPWLWGPHSLIYLAELAVPPELEGRFPMTDPCTVANQLLR